MHRAVNDDCVSSIVMRLGNAANVLLACRVGKALVVNDNVVALCPVRILVQVNLSLRAITAFIHHSPLHINLLLFERALDLLSLKSVVVAADRL